MIFPSPVHLDADNVPSETFDWDYQFPVGFDATGCTAQMVIDGISSGIALTVTVVQVGINTLSMLSVAVSNVVTNTWVPGVYPYRTIITGPDSTSDVATYGDLLVLTPRQGATYGVQVQLPVGQVDSDGATHYVPWNTPSWNKATNGETYQLLPDVTPQPHAVSWASGAAPTVLAPSGWTVRDPLDGSLNPSYTYSTRIGEDYDWVADPLLRQYWPR